MTLSSRHFLSSIPPSLVGHSSVQGTPKAGFDCCHSLSTIIFPICAVTTTGLERADMKSTSTTMTMSLVAQGRLGGHRSGAGMLQRLLVDHSSPHTAPRTEEGGIYNWQQGISLFFPSDKKMQQRSTSALLNRRNEEHYHASFHVSKQRWITSIGPQQNGSQGRRQALVAVLLLCSATLLVTQMPGKLLAEEVKKKNVDKDQSIGGLLSIFDPDEMTKLGKKLPKAYLKSARDVVQTLRASFSEDSSTDAKFRRNADSAKGAIREYISNWRGAKLVNAEESYQALERALRMLGEFYSKKGPSAVLPKDVRDRVLEDLQMADDAL